MRSESSSRARWPRRRSPPRLLDRVRKATGELHYSIRTEDAYADLARRFLLCHGKRDPPDIGAAKVTAFLTRPAVERNVAPSTQGQAKSALLLLCRHVLGVQLPWLDGVVSAKKQRRLPVVLTLSEVSALLHDRPCPYRCGSAASARTSFSHPPIVSAAALRWAGVVAL